MLISVVLLLFNATIVAIILLGIIIGSQYVIDGIYWVKNETLILIENTRNVLYGIGDSIVNLDDKIESVIRNLNSIDIAKFKNIC